MSIYTHINTLNSRIKTTYSRQTPNLFSNHKYWLKKKMKRNEQDSKSKITIKSTLSLEFYINILSR